MIKEIIESKQTEHISSGKFSISSIGQCWRKRYLIIKGEYKGDFDQKTLRTFSIGTLIHQQITKELFQKAEQFNWYVLAGELDIPVQRYFSGRCDLIMANSKTGEKVIVDVKSVSQWSFSKINEKEEYPYIENYKKQLQLYLHFFKIEKGILLFVNKSNSEIKETEIKYDKELCLRLIKEIEDFFQNYVEKDIAPPKCDGGQFGCDVCGKKAALLNK
jgi:hypothetical protein